MANYTVELRTIVEKGIPIFDFPYNFYNEEKRADFERNFIRHFYFREIGCETVDRFKWYLQDKMKTVFPYYNMLFESACIEYEVLDNYKLTETFTRNVENEGKSAGVSSTVGQAFNTQTSEQNQTTDGTGNRTTTASENKNATGNSKTTTTETVDNDTTTETNVDGTGTKTSNGTQENSSTVNSSGTVGNTGKVTNSEESLEKYLDTPQGAIDFSNAKYLTELRGKTTDSEQDTTNNQTTNNEQETTENQTTTGTENTTDTQKTTGKGTNDTVTDSESITETTNAETATGNTTSNETTKNVVNATGNVETNEKTTADNNTRTESTSTHKENYTITRKGNIGVDTDSDAIEKHIRLQKVLTNIEKMFFDECEDLFMLVF